MVAGSSDFLFLYTRPGSSAAWFITDGINDYRWIAPSDKAQFVADGVPVQNTPTYIATMTLDGPAPP